MRITKTVTQSKDIEVAYFVCDVCRMESPVVSATGWKVFRFFDSAVSDPDAIHICPADIVATVAAIRATTSHNPVP